MSWWFIGAAAALAAVVLVVARSRRSLRPTGEAIDPFTVGEPWRRFVQGAQRAARRLHESVDSTPAGPRRERLDEIAVRLDRGLDETWRIARRGDEIDDAVRRLDPPALRANEAALANQLAAGPSGDVEAALASVRSQLATTDRLKAQSVEAADRLRLTQTRLDELAARAAEISIGSGDADAYEHDVDDLVIELEALRLAIEETEQA